MRVRLPHEILHLPRHLLRCLVLEYLHRPDLLPSKLFNLRIQDSHRSNSFLQTIRTQIPYEQKPRYTISINTKFTSQALLLYLVFLNVLVCFNQSITIYHPAFHKNDLRCSFSSDTTICSSHVPNQTCLSCEPPHL